MMIIRQETKEKKKKKEDLMHNVVHLRLPHGAGSPLLHFFTLALLLSNAVGKELGIFGSSILAGLSPSPLEGDPVTLVLEALGSNKSLDLWSLGVFRLLGILWLDLTADNEFSDIIILGQTKKSPDLSCPLWAQPVGMVDISQAGNVTITLLDNDERQDSEIHANDAPPNGLPLPLTSAPWSVARMALGQQKSDTGRVHDTLLHWETLLVVSSSDLENVSLVLITNAVTGNLLTHAFVDKHTETALIVDFNELLGAIGGVCDIELHDCNDYLSEADKLLQVKSY